jgi:hypothetical protein
MNNKFWQMLHAQAEDMSLKNTSTKIRSIYQQLDQIGYDLGDKYDLLTSLQNQLIDGLSVFSGTDQEDVLNSVIAGLDYAIENLATTMDELVSDNDGSANAKLKMFVDDYDNELPNTDDSENYEKFNDIDQIDDKDFVTETGGDAYSMDDKLNGRK